MPLLKKIDKEIIAVFFICLCYWIYLIFSSSMAIRFDAIGYEGLGRTIYTQGWSEFFRTGPHREPLYPFSIACSMWIADRLAVSYEIIQRVFQILILFVSQILLLMCLQKLKVHKRIQLAIILYFGFSPAVVNSAFSLFGEIITYPFVLGILLCGCVSWQCVHARNVKRSIFMGCASAFVFMGAAFGKGVFLYVFIFYMLLFCGVVIYSLCKRDRVLLLSSISYVLTAIVLFQTAVVSYKFANKKYNGQFEFTDRYVGLLYGNAAKRASELTPRIFFAHLTSIPGGGVCRRFFTEEECLKCEFGRVDYFWQQELPKILIDTPQDQTKSKTFSLTIKKMLEHPVQYVFFMFVEMARMPFWESTHIGFVHYPPWLWKVFQYKPFKDVLRLGVSLVTYFSLFYLFLDVFRKRGEWIRFDQDQQAFLLCFFSAFIIFIYTFLHSPFSIVTRYALPIVPLYLLSVAYTMQNINSIIKGR